MTKRTVSSFQMTEADARKFDALEQVGFGTRTDIIRTALDRMYVQEIGSVKNNYPLGHKFFSFIDRGDDNPQSREEVTVIGYFKDKIQTGGYESGVNVQTADGYETQISYAYLNENGTGH